MTLLWDLFQDLDECAGSRIIIVAILSGFVVVDTHFFYQLRVASLCKSSVLNTLRYL